jgi:hypothetical protein
LEESRHFKELTEHRIEPKDLHVRLLVRRWNAFSKLSAQTHFQQILWLSHLCSPLLQYLLFAWTDGWWIIIPQTSLKFRICKLH